jgi:hypothetical protein
VDPEGPNVPPNQGGGGGSLTEVQMREMAADQAEKLELFGGVMSHLYTFSK